MTDSPHIQDVLKELNAMETIARVLEPLTPRMRAAVLTFVNEYLADKRDRTKASDGVPNLEEP